MTNKQKTREIGERAENAMRSAIAVTDELVEVNRKFMSILKTGFRHE